MLNKPRSLTLALSAIFLFTLPVVQAAQYVLLDPVTDKALPRTPYFLFFNGDSPQAKPLMTDAKGRTSAAKRVIGKDNGTTPLPLELSRAHPMGSGTNFKDPLNDSILVRAVGDGAQVFVKNLNNVASSGYANPADGILPEGSPYAIWQAATGEVLSGTTNMQGYSNAYFVNDSASWYTSAYAFILRTPDDCTQVRQGTINRLSSDPTTNAQGEVYVQQHFMLTIDEQAKARKNLVMRYMR